jgi:ABC-type polysaccharide/polyol phosphate transport system ATPase subunit
MTLVRLDNLQIAFRPRPADRVPLLRRAVAAMIGRPHPHPPIVHALRGLDLELSPGDRLGVIGPNGAGKSTLLRTIAGIYPPTGGAITVDGKVSGLFDITLGFERDATGRENIAYRGYLQGETPASIKQKIAAIAAFSGLGDALDRPVRDYSSGMCVRLAFAVATAIEPQILLIDEVLSAGDEAFRAKAKARILSLSRTAEIVVAVSHDLNTLRPICTRGVWLENGKIRQLGPIDEVIDAYRAVSRGADALPAAS